MGCGGSKPQPPSSHELAPTGGGSIIISKSALEDRSHADGATDGNQSMVVTKGGSYVIGRKYAGAWEPGDSIARPDNTLETRVVYVPVNETTVLRLAYAAVSEQGRSPRPPHKPNQDSFICMEAPGDDPSLALFAVFDGHGPKGEDASNFCRLNLPDIVVRSPLFPRTPFDALAESFEATHRRFISPELQRAGVDTTVSGSTAIAVMLRGNEFLCANVGDSRAMMGSVLPGGRGVIARPLSIDHKPNRPEEKARIKQSTGRILSERALGIEGGDPDKLYVCRVHAGAIRYGVLFTRSIGDADGHAHLGLSSAPELQGGRLTERDRFIVLASDGVWDYLDEDAVAGLVMDACADGHDDAQAATLNIVQTAKSCWERESVGGRRDDITVVTVLLRFMTTEEAKVEQAQRAALGPTAGPPSAPAFPVDPTRTSAATGIPTSATSAGLGMTINPGTVGAEMAHAIAMAGAAAAAASSASAGQGFTGSAGVSGGGIGAPAGVALASSSMTSGSREFSTTTGRVVTASAAQAVGEEGVAIAVSERRPSPVPALVNHHQTPSSSSSASAAGTVSAAAAGHAADPAASASGDPMAVAAAEVEAAAAAAST